MGFDYWWSFIEAHGKDFRKRLYLKEQLREWKGECWQICLRFKWQADSEDTNDAADQTRCQMEACAMRARPRKAGS